MIQKWFTRIRCEWINWSIIQHQIFYNSPAHQSQYLPVLYDEQPMRTTQHFLRVTDEVFRSWKIIYSAIVKDDRVDISVKYIGKIEEWRWTLKDKCTWEFQISIYLFILEALPFFFFFLFQGSWNLNLTWTSNKKRLVRVNIAMYI